MTEREIERERLVELLDIIIQPGEKTLGDIADYLLTNSVIVPPCKVGDKVYRIVKMSTGVRTKIKAVSEKGGTTGIMTSCDPTIKRFIRCVTVTKNNIVNCCENYGKTVFLTK